MNDYLLGWMLALLVTPFWILGFAVFYRWALTEIVGKWMTRPQIMKWYRQRLINQMIWKLDTQYHNDPGYNAVTRLLRTMKELE